MYQVHPSDLVKSFINSHHGWAVADQFEDTYNGESFEEQNRNALVYIRNAVRALTADRGPFSGWALEELRDYLNDLEIFLAKPSGE